MWAEKIAQQLLEKKLKSYNFTTGVTPSGPFHIGHLREVLTASIVSWFVEQENKKANFYFILDDFDHLRKLYSFLPQKFEKYIGQPLFLIPDPKGCHQNYAEHFFEPFKKTLKYLNLQPKIFRASELYKKGAFDPYIETALKNKEKIAEILKKVAKTKIQKNFSPFKPLCPKCHSLVDTEVVKTDFAQKKVQILCHKCGFKGKTNYTSGGGKLMWRLHWLAWWQYFNTSAEPFGKEHASVGSSYDTAKVLMKEIFQKEVPLGIPYDLIYLKGVKGKISSSKGNVVSVKDLTNTLPPEIIKYIILRVLPQKPIFFDPRDALRLSEEIAADIRRFQKNKLSKDKIKLYQYIFNTPNLKKITFVPWGHFILVAQLTQKATQIQKILKKSGAKISLREIKKLIPKALNWVKKYGSKNEKIKLCLSKPPKLSTQEKNFLLDFASQWQKKNLNDSELQNLIYESLKKHNLQAKQGFALIYRIFLNKKSGPRAGLLLNLIGKEKALSFISQITNS